VLGPANSVNDALELLSQERPNVAVLDFNLGGEKVTPVALQLKSLGVPFVLASASNAAEFARYPVFADVGNAGKPTDVKRLLNMLRALHG
jgi:DNA-binding response OmpR family regulator